MQPTLQARSSYKPHEIPERVGQPIYKDRAQNHLFFWRLNFAIGASMHLWLSQNRNSRFLGKLGGPGHSMYPTTGREEGSFGFKTQLLQGGWSTKAI